MICKHCQMRVLGKDIHGYCSKECVERDKVWLEISNFILYATHMNEQEGHYLYSCLTNYMAEVYEYTGEK